MICYGKDCKTSTAAGTLTNSVTVVSETPTADTAKMGNGFAKITLLSEQECNFAFLFFSYK